MPGPQLVFAEGEDFAVDFFGFAVAVLLGGDEGDFVHADQGFGVRGAEGLLAEGIGAAVLLFGLGVSADSVSLSVWKVHERLEADVGQSADCGRV